jgi:hypothetical protein
LGELRDKHKKELHNLHFSPNIYLPFKNLRLILRTTSFNSQKFCVLPTMLSNVVRVSQKNCNYFSIQH